jgi:hypothetical protein
MFHAQHAMGQYTSVAQQNMKTKAGINRPRSATAPMTIAAVVAQNCSCMKLGSAKYEKLFHNSLDRKNTKAQG